MEKAHLDFSPEQVRRPTLAMHGRGLAAVASLIDLKKALGAVSLLPGARPRPAAGRRAHP
jgi:hypothetical protein